MDKAYSSRALEHVLIRPHICGSPEGWVPSDTDACGPRAPHIRVPESTSGRGVAAGGGVAALGPAPRAGRWRFPRRAAPAAMSRRGQEPDR